METTRTLFTWKKVLPRVLPQSALAGAALIALWFLYRARRSVNELHPPDQAAILPDPAPPVSILLPVRNEAANIDACLASLVAQDYPNFTITVIDDGSTDATPARISAWCTRDARIQTVRVTHLPPGWAGKAHALHTGVLSTQGEWLLFTDADTRHEPQTLRLLMSHALSQGDDLLSMGLNLMTLSGPAMPLLMPTTSLLLALFMTPAEMKSPTSKHAFAFGQYMLLRREAYLATGGYGAPGMRTSATEDLALAEHIKHSGRQVEIVDGRELVHNRQWTTWQSARRGWSRSMYNDFVRSARPLAGFPIVLGLLAYGAGPAGVLLYALATRKARRASVVLAGLTLLAQIEAKRRFDHKYGLPWFWALTAPLAWILCARMALDAMWMILTDKRTTWKDRQIPRQERATYALKNQRRHAPSSPHAALVQQSSAATLAASHQSRDRDQDGDFSSGGSSESGGGNA